MAFHIPKTYKYVFTIAIIILIIVTVINYIIPNDPIPDQLTLDDEIPNAIELDNMETNSDSDPDNDTASESTSSTSQPAAGSGASKFSAPMSDWTSRVTKKTFGTYVTPINSPVSPEKFTGYHAAIDLEILPGEETSQVPVLAVCTGDVAIKKTASGYGGLVAQYCDYKGSPVLVLYGHVALSSVSKNVGDKILVGEQIGILGQPGPDTDDERKHLHLGIRRGQELVIAGYVATQNALASYFDPRELIQ